MAQQNTQQGQAQQPGGPQAEHAQLKQQGLDDATIQKAQGLGASLGGLLRFVQQHPEIAGLLKDLFGLFGGGSGTPPAAGQKP